MPMGIHPRGTAFSAYPAVLSARSEVEYAQSGDDAPDRRRLSMYCTASGRSYLSARPDRDVATIIAQSRLIGVNIAQSEFEYPSASASSAS